MKDEPVPGSIFNAQKNRELEECHEILDQYTEKAIQMAAEEVEQL